MRILIATLLFLSAASARADRYWDVPDEHATAIAKALEGELVLEYCSGCGDIFSLYRVKKAEVKKGDYSEGKQVHAERTLLMSGIDKSPFTFRGACGVTAEHLERDNPRVDIPYAFWRKGGQWRWIGEGRLDGRAPVLKVGKVAQENIDKCAGKSPSLKSAARKTKGRYQVQGAKISLSSNRHKTERVRKGRRVIDTMPALKMNIEVNKKKFTLWAPVHFPISQTQLVWAKSKENRMEVLVEVRGQNKIAHVFFEESKSGAWQAHIIPREVDDATLEFGDGEFRYERKRGRFVAKRTRFPMTDDLNFASDPRREK